MATSAQERKRKQRENEKAQLNALFDSCYPYLRQPFFERAANDPNWSSVTLPLELIGFEAPLFDDDQGPEHYAIADALPPDEDPAKSFPGAQGSIGRAEIMVDHLLDAAQELALIINRFKLDELAARRREIEEADLTIPEQRKRALEDIAQIARLESELAKNVRRTLPQWKVKGA